MGSETKLRLPIIDFSKVDKPGTPMWESVKNQVHQAVQDYGCFEALFDKVPMDLRKAIFAACEEMFHLPFETKKRNVSVKPYHGYVGQFPVLPLYESLGIEDAQIPANIETFVQTLWPDERPNFREIFESLNGNLMELDQIVRKMILESLGVERYIDEHINSTSYLLRFQKYEGPKTIETRRGLHTHTDNNTTTILYNNEVEGLQAQTKDGEWIEIKPSLDSFVFMIGQSLVAWTNGRVHPPYHRVMMKGNESRYSIGLFSVPKPGYIVKAPEELVDDEHPLLFKAFDHLEFLKFYYSEEGRKAKVPIKAYCGV